MTKTGNGKAVGYVRMAMHNGVVSGDAPMQQQLIQAYMKKHRYVPLSIHQERQTYKQISKTTGAKKLHYLMKLCEREGADLLYVDLGLFRNNAVFFDAVKRQNAKLDGWKFVEVPCTKSLYEFLERNLRKVKKFAPMKKKAPTKELDKREQALWKTLEANGVTRRQYRNAVYLCHGVISIYRTVLDGIKNKESDKNIAWELNEQAHLTLTGKMWNDETVRKIRNRIEDPADFIHRVRTVWNYEDHLVELPK